MEKYQNLKIVGTLHHLTTSALKLTAPSDWLMVERHTKVLKNFHQNNSMVESPSYEMPEKVLEQRCTDYSFVTNHLTCWFRFWLILAFFFSFEKLLNIEATFPKIKEI